VKTKVPKAGPKVIHRRTYKTFFFADVENIEWDNVLEKMHVNAALDYFMNLFSAVCDKHAPIKKLTVRSLKANLCSKECAYPDLWKITKVTPLSKDSREPLTGPNRSDPAISGRKQH